MDSYREHPSDFDQSPSAATTSAEDVAAAIGTDERRMHVRAYNYWASLLDGRDFPSIEDLEPESVEDFAGNSVLLDFTCGRDNPAMPYIGTAIRDECGLDDSMRNIAQVPSRSLLSRLTDHYMQIIANRAPVGFEAEFENQRGENICYRGILMPFSSDGETIDFIYGVINWKTVGEADGEQTLVAALPADDESAEPQIEELAPDVVEEPMIEAAAEEHPTWDDCPSAAPDADAATSDAEVADTAPVHFSWEDGPLADDEEEVTAPVLDENAGLADRLWAARETAEAVKLGEGRTRTALYTALSLAYDFALAARDNPQDYAELLEESGVKAQARAPMTPIVKLIFGVDYDKARLTEFSAALSFAHRQQVALGEFQDFIAKQSGGLKALVAAERQARRPEPKADVRGDAARAKLREARAISLAELSDQDEFALVLTRRGADGVHEPIAVVDDAAMIERAIRRTS